MILPQMKRLVDRMITKNIHASLTGQNITNVLDADTIYRFQFTDINGTLMTYPAASYILVAIDPITGQQYGGIQELIPSDTTGIYTPVNAFRLQVAEDLPNGLLIRHFGK